MYYKRQVARIRRFNFSLMAKEENKNIEKEEELEQETPEEKEEVVEEKEEETVSKDDEESEGVATFKKASNSTLPLIAVIVAVVLIVGALIVRGADLMPSFGSKGVQAEYVNVVHGYAYEYPEEMQLVAAGNIPVELMQQGVTSMAELNLTDGDSLIVRTNEETGDNIVYTILELSSRPNFVDFDTYVTTLFESLDDSKEVTGTDYVITENKVGEDKNSSTEYSFEMEVPIDEAGNTRTGVFYDNVFQTEDGKAYSISFGYPKDVENADEYVSIYRDLLKSFEIGVAVEEVELEVEDEAAETQSETEEMVEQTEETEQAETVVE